jgi:hypothetical protein
VVECSGLLIQLAALLISSLSCNSLISNSMRSRHVAHRCTRLPLNPAEVEAKLRQTFHRLLSDLPSRHHGIEISSTEDDQAAPQHVER